MSLRKLHGGECAVLNTHLVLQAQPCEVLTRLVLQICAFLKSQKRFEQKEIGKYGGKELAITVAVLLCDQFSVAAYFATLRGIQAHKHLGQGGLATAIAAGNEQQLAIFNSEIQRTECE